VDSMVALGRSFGIFHRMRMDNLETSLPQPWAKLPEVSEPQQWGPFLYPEEEPAVTKVIQNVKNFDLRVCRIPCETSK